MQQGKFEKTKKQFPLPSYAAELTLVQKTTRGAGAAVGGRVFNNSQTQSFTGGSGSAFPSLSGLGSTNLQHHNATRVILLKDVLADIELSRDPRTKALSFTDTCSQDPVGTLGIGGTLGITTRFVQTLEELLISPGIAKIEEYYFDFTVVVSIGGTVSFIDSMNFLTAGAGVSQTYNETLKVKLELK